MVLHPHTLAELHNSANAVRKRKALKAKEAERVNAFLSTVPLLEGMDDAQLRNLGSSLHSVAYKKGDVIWKAGDRGDEMFFVEHGQAAIVTNGEHLASYERGDHFGDQVLVAENQRRVGTVVAETKLSCLLLDKGAFQSLQASNSVWDGAGGEAG